MKISNCFCLDDFRGVAKLSIPKFVFDFIEGGAGNEEAVKSNTQSFKKFKLVPAIRSDSSAATMDYSVLGLNYSAPFGVAPLGLCGLVNRNAEIILAKAAAKYNVPYIFSAASNTSIVEVVNASGIPPWFQLYIPQNSELVDHLLEKAGSVGCPVLVVTVDTAIAGRRLRDLHNKLQLPFRPSLSNILEVAMHPLWALNQGLNGKLGFPNFENLSHDNKRLSFNELMSLQTGGELNWSVIEKIRQKWKGKMVLKGVLSTADAGFAKRLGIDAIIVSNHGGRQLSSAPAPISILPNFSKAEFRKEFLMLDSGIRSGEDIVTSLSLGACFTFIGRGFLYALAAGGGDGVNKLFETLLLEVRTTLKLLGCNDPKNLNSENIFHEIGNR